MDNNPALTKKLAATFESNPIFEDIAEELGNPGDKVHYMPTHTALKPIRPVGINPHPIKACATRKETLVVTTDTTKLITNAIKPDGSLKEKVPKAFNGDQTKTQKFLN